MIRACLTLVSFERWDADHSGIDLPVELNACFELRRLNGLSFEKINPYLDSVELDRLVVFDEFKLPIR